MTKVIAFFVLILFVENVYSQQTVDNDKAHRRYWYYRTRMINDFMKIGKEQGACIVFAQRNSGEDGVAPREFESKVGPDQIDITNQYIMTLALEYKILSRNHQDTRETIKELYHMLYAINRLDLEAEQFFTPAMMPSNDIVTQNGLQNGFILREDMPSNYIDQNKLHYNYALQERPTGSNDPEENYGGFTGAQHTNTLTTDNKFSAYFTGKQSLEDLTWVQDKYMSLLTAMMFVTKYIPMSEHYGTETFQGGGSSIKQEAADIANRCYNYLKNKNGSWNLHYQNIAGNYLYPLIVGNTAFSYSWALSRMACWANDPFPWSQNNGFACSGYNDATATTIGRVAYNGFTMGTYSCAEDNAVFKGWCQAGSNSPSYNNLGMLSPIYINMVPNTSYNSIEWADLLRKVLHQNGALLKQASVYGDAINVAPCQGPYNYGNCAHGGWEWSSQDRLEHPKARGFACNGNTPPHSSPCYTYIQNSGFQGNYPGVDYMLLHNLYYEYQNQLLDGNQGNVGVAPLGNAISVIFNAINNVPSLVSSAWCSTVNAFSGFFTGNSSVCDPTNTSNGSANLVGYRGAINLMDNRDENVWPRNIGNPFSLLPTQGTDAHFAKVAVFQNLSSIAHLYATSSPAAPQNTIPSNVVYRAGKEIVLEPGFTVDAGSTFHAYVQRYLCNGKNDALNMRKAKDSTLTIDLADYESDMINPIPIHYVESPKSDADNNPVVTEESSPEDYIADLKSLDEEKTSEFEISPNPTSAKTTVRTNKSSSEEVFTIHVYDMKGGLVQIYENVSSEFEIDLSSNSKGVYMVRVISNLGNSVTKKISLIE